MRKRINKDCMLRERIISLCEPVDCGILSPPMKAQVAVDELCRYFLGENWYDTSGLTNTEQINTNIVYEIESKYKGAKKDMNIK